MPKKEEYQNKFEEKLWVRIKVPATAEYLLGKLTKVELTNIRQYLQLKGVSTLKKEELVGMLIQELVARGQEIFSELDEDQFHLIKHMVENGGWTDQFDLSLMQIVYLRDKGLVFPGIAEGRKVLVMATELVEAFTLGDERERLGKIQQNTYWIRLVRGLLHYYGVLSPSQLTDELLQREMITLDDIPRFTILLEMVHKFYRGYKAFENGLAHPAAPNPFKLLQEQGKRADLPFYPFTNGQLITAGAPYFVDKNEGFLRFCRFLEREFDVSEEKAEELTDTCVLFSQEGGSLQPLMDFIGHNIPIPDFSKIKLLMEELVRLSNHTRKWVLKGYMPVELVANESQSSTIEEKAEQSVKIGRNDPCPCGSGKKYKKCCMDKNGK